MRLKVGTRGSKLAIKQAEIFINSLSEKLSELGEKAEFDIVIVKTKGDKILDSPLSKVPGKGFFVKELEEELINGNIHFAVHSLKDVPTDIPEKLTLAAFMKRESPHDVIIGLTPDDIRALGKERKIKVGTSSLRREIQLIEKFGNLIEIIPLRGNLDTRINKIKQGACDAIVVAYCGVKRLGLENLISYNFTTEEFLYPPGQGIISIETKKDSEYESIAKLVDDKVSRFLGEIERGILKYVGGGCNIPVGICTICDDKLYVRFRVFGKIEYDRTFERFSFDSSQILEDVLRDLTRIGIVSS